MVRDAVRRHDRTHLILGDRYAQYYDLPVVRASAPYVDAISTNYGAEWLDGGMSRFFLDTLHAVTRKPVVITEFYMTARENRSGNRNSSGGFPIVQTQAERADAFRAHVAGMADRPYVIGAHWFQFYDEPPLGRGDGEDYNMGLVDVHGQPYELLTAASAAVRPEVRHREAKPVPIANTAAPAPPDVAKDLRNWDRARSLVAPSRGTPFGDLYVSWTPDALYVGLFAMDYMDERLYAEGRVPEADRPMWTVRVGGASAPITVRYGGKDRPATVSDPAVTVTEVPGLKHTVILRLPRANAAGERVRLDSALRSHSGAETMAWRREVRLVR
jgi:hypothetical protein